MNSLRNFDYGFPIPPQEAQLNDSSWVSVTQQKQQPSNWTEMGPISSGYLHELPNPILATEERVFGFDFGYHRGNSIPELYQQDLGIGSNDGCYPNESLSDILVLGDAGYISAMEQNLKRKLPTGNPVLDLNLPADSDFWSEFDSQDVVLTSQSTNLMSSLITDVYSGQSTVLQFSDTLRMSISVTIR